jgi:hypothetical protein
VGVLRDLYQCWGQRAEGQRQSAKDRQYRPQVGYARLEDRTLQTFTAGPLRISTQILPPNNRLDPISVSGTFSEFHVSVVNNTPKITLGVQPGPKRANFQVVDQYREVQPRGPITLNLIDPTNGIYSFSFTFNLQATRRNADINGRQYHVIVGAGDKDGWNGKVFTVLVPHDISAATAKSPKTPSH